MDVTKEHLWEYINRLYPQIQQQEIFADKKLTSKGILLLRHIQKIENPFGDGTYGKNCVQINICCKDMEKPVEAEKFEAWLNDGNCDLYFARAYKQDGFSLRGKALGLSEEAKKVAREYLWQAREKYPEFVNTITFYVFGKIADLVSTGLIDEYQLLDKLEKEIQF